MKFYVEGTTHLPVVLPAAEGQKERVITLAPGAEIPANVDPAIVEGWRKKGLVRVVVAADEPVTELADSSAIEP